MASGQETAVVNTLLLFRRRHGAVDDIKQAMRDAARSAQASHKGLAALLSFTRQLLQLIAIYNSRGFILRKIASENFVLKGSGEILLTGFSPLLEEGKIYYETEAGEVVTEAPTQKARSFRPHAHENGLQLAGVLFGLWCDGPAAHLEAAAYPQADFSACIPGMPPPVPRLIESLLGASGNPRLTPLEALQSHAYGDLVAELRRVDFGDGRASD